MNTRLLKGILIYALFSSLLATNCTPHTGWSSDKSVDKRRGKIEKQGLKRWKSGRESEKQRWVQAKERDKARAEIIKKQAAVDRERQKRWEVQDRGTLKRTEERRYVQENYRKQN